MESKILPIEPKQAKPLACSIFQHMSGEEEIVPEAELILQKEQDSLGTTLLVAEYNKAELKFYEDTLAAAGISISCQAFESINWEKIKKAVFFIITQKEGRNQEEGILEKLYLDMWKSAYLNASLKILWESYMPGKPLQVYGPGYYGMAVDAIKDIYTLLSGEKIGVTLNEKFIMQPEKTTAGVFFVSQGDEMPEGLPACDFCRANKTDCSFCMVKWGKRL